MKTPPKQQRKQELTKIFLRDTEMMDRANNHIDPLTRSMVRGKTPLNKELKVICNGKINHDFYISLYLFTHAMHKKHIFNY